MKLIVIALCLILMLSLAGCTGKLHGKKGDTAVRIADAVYADTGKAVPVEPDESAVVHTEFFTDDGTKITAYAILEDGRLLVCLIDNEWIEFQAAVPGK